MRISTRGRYGLRAMFELARGFEGPPVLMSTIAERQGLSRKHLHALLTSLKSAGLVRSIRGRRGGFLLARPPTQIRLSEILLALEGPMSLVDCVANQQACDKSTRCRARRIWQDLAAAIENVLDGVSLAEVSGPERAKRSKPRRMQKGRRSGKRAGC
jgi:Rrf2 family protein